MKGSGFFMFQLRLLMQQSKENGLEVAAVIVEPIQAEGGDNHGTPSFFRGIQEIAQEVNLFVLCELSRYFFFVIA